MKKLPTVKGHIGECIVDGMIDEVVCSCGWKSGPFFDGMEYAVGVFCKHIASIKDE